MKYILIFLIAIMGFCSAEDDCLLLSKLLKPGKIVKIDCYEEPSITFPKNITNLQNYSLKNIKHFAFDDGNSINEINSIYNNRRFEKKKDYVTIQPRSYDVFCFVFEDGSNISLVWCSAWGEDQFEVVEFSQTEGLISRSVPLFTKVEDKDVPVVLNIPGFRKSKFYERLVSSVHSKTAAEKPAAKLEVKELLAVQLEPVKREGRTYQFEMIVQNISDKHFFLHVEDPVASWGCTSFRTWVGAQAYLDRNEVTCGVPGSFQGMVISPREERRLFVTGEATEDGKILFRKLQKTLPVFSADAEISVRLLLNAADYDAGVCTSGPLESNRVKLEFPFPLCQEDKELYTPEHFQKLQELQKESPERELPPVPR